MDESDRASRGSLHCSCGFFTSHATYMLDHLKTSDCQLTYGQIETAIALRLREIATQRMAIADTVASLDIEEAALNKIVSGTWLAQWRKAMPRKARHCVICHQPTNETFGGSPQCLRHTAGRQEVVVKGKVIQFTDRDKRKVSDILEKLMYGKDDE
jgi:hypothetical protein